MATPSTGAISFSAVNTEIGIAATSTRSLGDSYSRDLAGVATGAISFSSLRGKSAHGSVSYSVAGTYSLKLRAWTTSVSTSISGGGGGGRGEGYTYGANTVYYGAGGLAGAGANTILSGLTPLETLTLVVGAGGAGGVPAGSWGADPSPAGGAGGSSVIYRGATPLLSMAGGAGGSTSVASAECSTAAGAGYVGGSGGNNWQGIGGGVGTHAGVPASATAPGAGGAGGNYAGTTCYVGAGYGQYSAGSGAAGIITITW